MEQDNNRNHSEKNRKNKKRHRKNGAFFVIGILLIAGALGLTAYNVWDSWRAGNESQKILDQLDPIIENNLGIDPDADESLAEGESESEGTGSTGAAKTLNDPSLSPSQRRTRTMPTTMIDGYEYIGELSVPSVNIQLPVMASWDYDRLKISPCRYSGSYYSDDLVICGHNYSRHFSPIKWADLGSDVYFTNVEGLRIHYVIQNIETLAPTAVRDMISNDQNSTDTADWDLTLFTCNTGGQTRCAVRCVRVSEEDEE